MSRQFYSRADRKAGFPRCLMGRSRRSFEGISRRDRRERESMIEFWRKKDARRVGRMPPRMAKARLSNDKAERSGIAYKPYAIRHFASEADLSVLNIAGPRESKAPGIYAATLALLREVWP